MKISKKLLLILCGILLLFIGITLTTNFMGSTDIDGFVSSAKYFAGHDLAKMRSSHSYLWGFFNAPLVALFGSLIGFKILNLIILFLISYSVYYISGKKKESFLLMVFSPILWYMAPWINSLQIASLLFLWCYYFIKQYDEKKDLKSLFYSGVLFGLAASFWHALFFFGFFLLFFFMINKKLSHTLFYLFSICVGLIPLFIFDFCWFGFPFHSLIKNNIGTISNLLGWGMNQEIGAKRTLVAIGVLFFMIPFYFWKFYNSKYFKKNWKTMLFLSVSLLIILKNPQPRYLFLLIPIMMINLSKILTKKQIQKTLAISLVLSLIVIIPYEIQIKYLLDEKDSHMRDVNGYEIKIFLQKLLSGDLNINSLNKKEIIKNDLNLIAEEYPYDLFMVGNLADDYYLFQEVYWGKEIRELVSIQDYELFLANESNILSKEFRYPLKNQNERREIWISGGIGKPLNDKTDYASINYALSLEDNFKLEGFSLIKKYEAISIFEKTN